MLEHVGRVDVSVGLVRRSGWCTCSKLLADKQPPMTRMLVNYCMSDLDVACGVDMSFTPRHTKINGERQLL